MNYQQQHNRTAERRREHPENVIDIDAEQPENEAAEQSAKDTDDHVSQAAKSVALHDLIGYGACDSADDNPDKPSPDSAYVHLP